MSWLLRKVCAHKNLSKVTYIYYDPCITTTRGPDYEIICPRCGQVFVDMQNYKRIAEIIMNQPDTI
jgi:hypothetical protein